MAAANKQSQRELSRDKMLEEALSRPGVRETMEVYQMYSNWQFKGRSKDGRQPVIAKPKKKTRATSSGGC